MNFQLHGDENDVDGDAKSMTSDDWVFKWHKNNKMITERKIYPIVIDSIDEYIGWIEASS